MPGVLHLGQRQIFPRDPNGIGIAWNFPAVKCHMEAAGQGEGVGFPPNVTVITQVGDARAKGLSLLCARICNFGGIKHETYFF